MRVVATAVVGIMDGETVFGLTPPELVPPEDPDTVRGVATAVVDSADGETPVEGSNSVLGAGECFRYNSDRSTAPAISTTAIKTGTRTLGFIRERIALKHHEDS